MVARPAQSLTETVVLTLKAEPGVHGAQLAIGSRTRLAINAKLGPKKPKPVSSPPVNTAPLLTIWMGSALTAVLLRSRPSAKHVARPVRPNNGIRRAETRTIFISK